MFFKCVLFTALQDGACTEVLVNSEKQGDQKCPESDQCSVVETRTVTASELNLLLTIGETDVVCECVKQCAQEQRENQGQCISRVNDEKNQHLSSINQDMNNVQVRMDQLLREQDQLPEATVQERNETNYSDLQRYQDQEEAVKLRFELYRDCCDGMILEEGSDVSQVAPCNEDNSIACVTYDDQHVCRCKDGWSGASCGMRLIRTTSIITE